LPSVAAAHPLRGDGTVLSKSRIAYFLFLSILGTRCWLCSWWCCTRRQSSNTRHFCHRTRKWLLFSTRRHSQHKRTRKSRSMVICRLMASTRSSSASMGRTRKSGWKSAHRLRVHKPNIFCVCLPLRHASNEDLASLLLFIYFPNWIFPHYHLNQCYKSQTSFLSIFDIHHKHITLFNNFIHLIVRTYSTIASNRDVFTYYFTLSPSFILINISSSI
jgi:hypothetical protein